MLLEPPLQVWRWLSANSGRGEAPWLLLLLLKFIHVSNLVLCSPSSYVVGTLFQS